MKNTQGIVVDKIFCIETIRGGTKYDYHKMFNKFLTEPPALTTASKRNFYFLAWHFRYSNYPFLGKENLWLTGQLPYVFKKLAETGRYWGISE